MKRFTELIKENYYYIFYILIVFAIPLSFKFQPAIMALWVLLGIISIHRIKVQDYRNYILLLFPVVYYVIHAIGVIYSENVDAGFSDLEVKLSILFIPLASLFLSEKIKINYLNILKVFVLANIVASMICLVNAFIHTVEMNEAGRIIFEFSAWPDSTKGYSFFQLVNARFNKFSYGFLSFIHHPSYFSIYILFSIVILIYLMRKERRYKFIYLSFIIYFTIFLWLLASRAAYITYILILGVYFIRMGLKYNLKWILLGTLFLALISSVVIFSNKQIRTNISDAIKISTNEELTEDSDMRFWLWKASMEIWNENILFGVGTGDADSFYRDKYEKLNLQEAFNKEYNAHNQFLDEGVKQGLLGVLVLASWFIYTLYISYKNRNFLLFYFALIFIINCMFEVLFNRIAAISFFAIFYSFLVSLSIKNAKSKI